jgi:adenylyltransferase/sulfurtransferase
MLTNEQSLRFQRQLIIPEISTTGQEKLLQSKVLVIGAGGLGSAVLYYLAAAGVGNIGIVDNDRVELSNLNRQIIHGTPDLGQLKTLSARNKLKALNPEVNIIEHGLRLTGINIDEILAISKMELYQ